MKETHLQKLEAPSKHKTANTVTTRGSWQCSPSYVPSNDNWPTSRWVQWRGQSHPFAASLVLSYTIKLWMIILVWLHILKASSWVLSWAFSLVIITPKNKVHQKTLICMSSLPYQYLKGKVRIIGNNGIWVHLLLFISWHSFVQVPTSHVIPCLFVWSYWTISSWDLIVSSPFPHQPNNSVGETPKEESQGFHHPPKW